MGPGGATRRALAVFVALFGGVCMAIATSHILLGARVVPGSIPGNATMDSEDRFYATLFLGFGAALIWTSGALGRRSGLLMALLAVFFLGGIARIFSWLAVGPPIALFQYLGALELILPPLLWWWHRRCYPG